MKGDEFFFKLMIAHRVIAIAPGLEQADRLVAGALLAHYNTKTGRCDPSAERIATLLSCGRATVFRAIKRLVDAKLFERQSYGGRSHRNAYAPQWDAFEKMNNRPSSETVVAATEPSHQKDGEPSHQRYTNENDLNEDSSSKPLGGVPPKERPKGQAGKSKPSGQRFMIHALDGGRSASHQEAAEAAQQRRLAKQINSLPSHERERAWLAAMQAAG